jgi:hypothetical protein
MIATAPRHGIANGPGIEAAFRISTRSTTPKHTDRLHKAILILRSGRHRSPVFRNHIDDAHRAIAIDIDERRVRFDAEDVVLAVVRAAVVGAGGGPVIEEGVEPHAVDSDILGVEDAEAPGVSASAAFARAGGRKVGVVDGGVDGPGSGSRGVGLVVATKW